MNSSILDEKYKHSWPFCPLFTYFDHKDNMKNKIFAESPFILILEWNYSNIRLDAELDEKRGNNNTNTCLGRK